MLSEYHLNDHSQRVCGVGRNYDTAIADLRVLMLIVLFRVGMDSLWELPLHSGNTIQ